MQIAFANRKQKPKYKKQNRKAKNEVQKTKCKKRFKKMQENS